LDLPGAFELNDAVIPLAAGFGPAERADWLALVERTLKGAAFETLVSRTADGVDVQPLYEPTSSAPLPSWRSRAGERAWDVRTLTWHPDPARANADILDDLAGGASSVVLAVWDPSHVARALEAVMTDVATVALDAGFLGPKAADALDEVVKASPAAPLAFHMDPISALAREGASPGPIESHLISAATVGARLATTYPEATLMLASGQVVHEAGGSEAQELAFMASAAVAYAKSLVRAGMSMEAALRSIVLRLAADQEYFLTIAKLRAARRIWARIAEACGVEAPARIEARSSGRMFTAADPWTNLIRLTAAGVGAAVGGADAIVLGAFTDALGLPSPLARRQARNTQLVLMEEAQLGRVADPAAGSGYLESLTDALANEAWGRFQAIEAAGGVLAALQSGAVAEDAAAARATLAADVREGRRRIVGVTDFKAADPGAVEFEPVSGLPEVFARLPGPDSTCPPLAAWRLEDAT
jgi:methylmalonyl-CoA mutase